MDEINTHKVREQQFRKVITVFITERRDTKLKEKDDPEVAKRYEYEAWLADAVRRVSQIQAVTHVLKATHPDARGSSLHITPTTLPDHVEVGSHQLGADYALDVVGNAAALDVFKLLKQEVDDRSLLDWMHDDDIDLKRALHPDAETATEWMQAFSSLVRNTGEIQSHETAKQVYWLVGDDPSDNDNFQLLQPMFSSSLEHVVHADIQDARFGDNNKSARKAKRNKEPSEVPYRDYRNLVARKLGGTKPQNISQLNSERGGVNYLLASLPPTWEQSHTPQISNHGHFWNAFRWQSTAKHLLRELTVFLKSEPPANMVTRRRREGMEQALGASLASFADKIHATHEPGWTREEDCQLPPCLKLWLDPGRLDLPARTNDPQAQQEDEAFKADYHLGDWPDDVAGQFANWLNGQLRDAGLKTVGDAEYNHWAKQAIIDTVWPIPRQRHSATGGES